MEGKKRENKVLKWLVIVILLPVSLYLSYNIGNMIAENVVVKKYIEEHKNKEETKQEEISLVSIYDKLFKEYIKRFNNFIIVSSSCFSGI